MGSADLADFCNPKSELPHPAGLYSLAGASVAITQPTTGKLMGRQASPKERLKRLSAVLEGARSMLIIVQNTPDPDAIAAAAALRELANERHEIACSIGHSGAVWRAENLALLRYLGLKTRDLGDLDLERFDRLCMVDAQPGAGNVTVDSAIRLDVVIDHHPSRRETRSARVTDVGSR